MKTHPFVSKVCVGLFVACVTCSVQAKPVRVFLLADPKAGYELAGFVWFQGWNDIVDTVTYPDRNKPGGYDLYAELLAHFIRDVQPVIPLFRLRKNPGPHRQGVRRCPGGLAWDTLK